MLDAFLRHRREVVTRRTVYELRKARERGHMLEGLAIALANIDEIIALIKASPSPAGGEGRAGRRRRGRRARCRRCWRARARSAPAPMARPRFWASSRGGYRLTEIQAQAILDTAPSTTVRFKPWRSAIRAQ